MIAAQSGAAMLEGRSAGSGWAIARGGVALSASTRAFSANIGGRLESFALGYLCKSWRTPLSCSPLGYSARRAAFLALGGRGPRRELGWGRGNNRPPNQRVPAQLGQGRKLRSMAETGCRTGHLAPLVSWPAPPMVQ